MRKLLFLLSVSTLLGACTTAPPYQATSNEQRPQDVSGIRYVEIIGSSSNIVIKGDQQPEVVLYDTPQVYDRDGETLYLEVDNAEKFRLKVPRPPGHPALVRRLPAKIPISKVLWPENPFSQGRGNKLF